jgi:hypothetical protein
MPRARTLHDLANVFNVSVVWLETGNGNKDVSETGRVREDQGPAYRSNRSQFDCPDDEKAHYDPYKSVVEALIDEIPRETLLKTLQALGGQVGTGDLCALEKSRLLIELIKDRRPETFEN